MQGITFLRGVLVILGYTALYIAAREASVTHWVLSAGLRFTAMLFLPARMWPFVIAGDLIGSLYYRSYRLDEYGFAWLFTAVALPPIATLIPVIALRKIRWLAGDLQLPKLTLRLLNAMAAAAALNAAVSVGAMELVHYSASTVRMPEGPIYYYGIFMLGNLMGALVIAPAGLLLLLARRRRARQLIGNINAGFGHEIAASITLLAGLIYAYYSLESAQNQDIARLLMLVPAVWMTCRYGWVGAVALTVLGNIALRLTLIQVSDLNLLESQVLLALCSSMLLVFGAIITRLRTVATLHQVQSGSYLQLARRNLLQADMRAHRLAKDMQHRHGMNNRVGDPSCLFDSSSASHATAAAAARWFRTTKRTEVQRTIDAMDLSMIESRGIISALTYGPLAKLLFEENISFAARLSSNAASLPRDLQLVIYRLCYSFTVSLARDHNAARIAVRLSVPRHSASAILAIRARPARWHEKRRELPDTYLDDEEVDAIVRTFHGRIHDDRAGPRRSISIILRTWLHHCS
ncbi:hypothetical protein EO087_01745 [Dyella sp. M7H15-1]|uniref:MASE1 domain-containing protein n=1 Tax=Dyella sp. M7H15-1 TaxID=2501295 RepID=UPI001004DCFC|nr:MASE1 domain-containing protein [Dyella sp. M7H15-1]QAU22866.1 hypothetical protein EO087_01745 [Dyella sp. M7H15-1]